MNSLTQAQKRRLSDLLDPLAGALFRLSRWPRGGSRWSALPDAGNDGVRADGSPLRLLVVRLDTIGDILLSEPALAALRRRFPRARLDLVTSPAGVSLLAGNPQIDRLIPCEGPWHRAWRGGKVSWAAEVGRLLRLVGRLRAERYDLGFELRGDPRDIAFLAATAPGATVGCSYRGGRRLLDYDAPADTSQHRVAFNQAIVGLSGARPEGAAPRLYDLAAARSVAEDLLRPLRGSLLLAFHLGAGFPSKCLPVETFASVAQRLRQSRNGHRPVVVLLLGGAEDRTLAGRFVPLVSPPVCNLVGQLALKETAAVLERCHLFIGNDSGPMHLAAAVGTPIVCCFGPSPTWQYHPVGAPYRLVSVPLDCRPCDMVHCVWDRYRCMEEIEAKQVVAAAEELLDLRPQRVPGFV
ncbi:MAG: glycosyltransferase family 9 protein [Chloroflexi bacterium]|nr:glycosyltransferase family 9 protein [Chloroflexota bacterium]